MTRLEAVIFDWAGTTVDHGSLAPVRAVTQVFRRRGITVTDADARRDMGIFKRDHIARVLAMPHVASQWRSAHGAAPADGDVESLFAHFLPTQMAILEDYSGVIDGVAAAVARLRQRRLRIGSTTGYTRRMLEVLVSRAKAQGYEADIALCPDDVGGGRPRPWMCLQIALAFQVGATAAVVKVGDTVSDIEEALNAGMWAVGVAATGNEIGLNASDLAALPDGERRRLLDAARERLKAAGAHYVIDSAAAVDSVLDPIEQRLAAGERP
ncbi:MAG TPA: phosphonoacetaldehyde hydrolase [Vicinamibacterales bacterium]|nr:phosphonoacetaldehyde hydrolase [Vicinamibacterales bacterium]